MSELTRCNYCLVQSMKVEAKAEGVEVIVRVEKDGEMKGWTSARYSNKDKPSAYSLELTGHCVC